MKHIKFVMCLVLALVSLAPTPIDPSHFWPPWFANEKGATPGLNLFLEPAGELHSGGTLVLTAWGLTVPSTYALAAGASTAFQPVPSGAVMVPLPTLVLPVSTMAYGTLDLAIPIPDLGTALPKIYLQAWHYDGHSWTATNGVSCDFGVWKSLHP